MRLSVALALLGITLTLLSCSSTQSKLDKLAKDLQKPLPLQVDSETTWTNVESGSDNSLVYIYSLKTVKASDVTSGELEQKLKPGVMEQYRTHPAMKPLRDLKVTLVYRYKDSTGASVGEFSVKASEL